jgi:hypothetical protein
MFFDCLVERNAIMVKFILYFYKVAKTGTLPENLGSTSF